MTEMKSEVVSRQSLNVHVTELCHFLANADVPFCRAITEHCQTTRDNTAVYPRNETGTRTSNIESGIEEERLFIEVIHCADKA